MVYRLYYSFISILFSDKRSFIYHDKIITQNHEGGEIRMGQPHKKTYGNGQQTQLDFTATGCAAYAKVATLIRVV